MSDALPPRPILAAEDDETDALILRKSFERARVSQPLIILPDGREAVDYLDGQGKYADRAQFPLPCLFILDLKMPHVNGFEVLSWLAEQPQFNTLPVLVLSASYHEADKVKARELGARDYYTKPMGFAESVKLIQEIAARWLPPQTTPSAPSNSPTS